METVFHLPVAISVGIHQVLSVLAYDSSLIEPSAGNVWQEMHTIHLTMASACPKLRKIPNWLINGLLFACYPTICYIYGHYSSCV